MDRVNRPHLRVGEINGRAIGNADDFDRLRRDLGYQPLPVEDIQAADVGRQIGRWKPQAQISRNSGLEALRDDLAMPLGQEFVQHHAVVLIDAGDGGHEQSSGAFRCIGGD